MSRRSLLRRAFAAICAIPALLSLPAAALASPQVMLRAGLNPVTLGASTTLSIRFRILTGAGQQPPPLSAFSVRLPAGMGFAATTLGLETCSTATLLSSGPGGCPLESVMGFGSAQALAPFGSQTVLENAHVVILMTKPVDRHTTMLFYFDGRKPVLAPLVMQTEVLPSQGSAGSLLSTAIPPIPTTPDAADVAMVSLQADIGPRGLHYFKRVHGRTVAYRPQGLNVPEACPRGGFSFSAQFTFQDGSQAAAESVVPCPPRRSRHHRTRTRRHA